MCLAMFIYMRSIVLTRETANEILLIYQKYPQLSGEYLKELIGLAWSLCHELRTLKDNHNNTNTNWYENQGKTQKLGLMQRGGYNETMKEAKKKESFLASPPQQQPAYVETSPAPSPERVIEKPSPIAESAPVVPEKKEVAPQPIPS